MIFEVGVRVGRIWAKMRRLNDAAKNQIVAFMLECSTQLVSDESFALEQAEEMLVDLFEFINTFDDSETYDFLRQLLRERKETALVNQAFDALIQMPRREPAQFLAEVLRHSDAGWRCAGCRALGNLGARSSSKAIQLLCTALLQDEDADVRYAAAEALEEVGDETALSALQFTIEHDKGVDYETFPIAGAAQKAVNAIQRRRSELL
ncbi:HEAT repeat domain-containing protein [Deinococcus lacus]|uniref:HEAT repeat domain-containing protein n=1 Tax=Deinococcus lacus TaxID=392561 RepID=A0ABW1YDF1_9DEIO